MSEIKRYSFTIPTGNNDNAKIIKKLESTKNISGYLRELILNDIHNEQDYNNCLNNLEERFNKRLDNHENRIKKLEMLQDDPDDENYYFF